MSTTFSDSAGQEQICTNTEGPAGVAPPHPLPQICAGGALLPVSTALRPRWVPMAHTARNDTAAPPPQRVCADGALLPVCTRVAGPACRIGAAAPPPAAGVRRRRTVAGVHTCCGPCVSRANGTAARIDAAASPRSECAPTTHSGQDRHCGTDAIGPPPMMDADGARLRGRHMLFTFDHTLREGCAEGAEGPIAPMFKPHQIRAVYLAGQFSRLGAQMGGPSSKGSTLRK
ncbi:hypothetical protein L226DRAFT_527665 [Lentinus tigrinus ALCF2SS1-7]|uniref:uncharacterized protein n=1 Tax=Lentinus tigrinus ALCF2SS1-7 TaxID=1328758 RepID=UPI0011663B27|nr:hypothetical protein L226DRAFT_527665 [Lentinus tigrinus ALCF2SS1-7]